MLVKPRFTLFAGGVFFFLACSSSSSTPPGADGGHDAAKEAGKQHKEASAPEAGGGIPDVVEEPVIVNDPDNCVKPGTKSNTVGVGGYCNAKGAQCMATGGAATLCTADLDFPAHEWFCTITCTKSSDCGPGATCAPTAESDPICVPSACQSVEVPADGGPLFDAAGDAPHASDAGSGSGSDAGSSSGSGSGSSSGTGSGSGSSSGTGSGSSSGTGSASGTGTGTG